jgi:hypothetical protein
LTGGGRDLGFRSSQLTEGSAVLAALAVTAVAFSRNNPAYRLGYFLGGFMPIVLLILACYRWKPVRYVTVSLVVLSVVCKTIIALNAR